MDKLLKALIYDGDVSVTIIRNTESLNTAIEIHGFSPVAAAAFGRTMTACTFMASGLKNASDRLYCTVKGDGIGGKITVAGDGNLYMRGCVDEPKADLPNKPNGKLDVGGFVGKNGRITVVKSMGLKEPYSGSSRLVSGEIAEDFTAYFALSEQQPTAMALGVLIDTDGKAIGSGGVIVQAMPGAREESLIKAENTVKSLTEISKLIKDLDAEGVFSKYFNGYEYSEYHPQYKCACSRDYVKGVVVSLGKTEAENIIKEQGKIKIDCEFCGKSYIFTSEDLEEIF